MKKVCIMTSVHEPFDARIFHKEGVSLARAGYDVVLIAPHPRREIVNGIRINGLKKRASRLGRILLTTVQVFRGAVREKAEAYHFHDPELLAAGLLLKCLGKKVIYDAHEDFAEVLKVRDYAVRLPVFLRNGLAPLIDRAEKTAARFLDCVIAATDTIEQKFRRAGVRADAIKNYPFIEPDNLPARPLNKENFRIIFVGAIYEARGILELIEACSLIDKRRSVLIELYGSAYPQFLRRIKEADADGRVNVHGVIPFEEVGRRMREADVGYICHRPEERSMVALPIKLFEYMSAGIPVIASDFPMWREIVDNAGCGLLVDPLNPRAIGRAIEYLRTHAEEARAMGMRGREAVQKRYNWGTQEGRLLQVYESLLGLPSSGAAPS